MVLAGLFPTTGVSALRKLHQQTAGAFAHGRSVHYVNRRSGLARGMTIGELAAELADGIGHSFPAPVDLLGMSTGGSIAQQLAADHPHVVRRLVLLSTGARLSPETRFEMAEIAEMLRAGRAGRALSLAGAALLPPGPWRPIGGLAAAVAGLATLSPGNLEDLAATVEMEDAFDLARCPQISAPTLIVSGERDQFYPLWLIEQTAALIPGSSLHLVPEHGHMSVTGLPEVHREILGFLG